MNWLTSLLSILLAAQTAPATAPAHEPSSQPTSQQALHATIEPGLYWNLLKTDQFAIGIPQNWSNIPPRSNMVMFLAKQGIKDENRQPLEVGISIERLTKPTEPVSDEAKKLLARYAAEKTITIEGEPVEQKVKLADGEEAMLISLKIVANNRRTFMQKLLINGPENRWVVSGYITAGEKSILPNPDSDMAKKVQAHLLTFTLDPKKLDQQPLQRAYLSSGPGAPAPTSQPGAQ